MTDLTETSAIPPPATNGALPGALPTEDAAGQTVAAIAEADNISAGKSDPIENYNNNNSSSTKHGA
jgi:ubiquitin-like 1-activating enzyme E1 A